MKNSTVTLFIAVGFLSVIKLTTVNVGAAGINTSIPTDLQLDNTNIDVSNSPYPTESVTTHGTLGFEEGENTRASPSKPNDPLQTDVSTVNTGQADSSSSPPCPTCRRSKDQIVDEELETQRRIERFKLTILHKLQLTEPPNITKPTSALGTLPTAVFQTGQHQPPNHRTHEGHHRVEETTSDLYLFADEDQLDCDFPETSVCIRFPVSSRPKEQRLASAQLWVYLTPDESNTTTKRTLLVSFPANYYGRRYTLATKDVYIREGWVELPLRHAIKRFETSQHYIEITCKPNSLTGSTIAGKGSLRPILAQTYALKNRERRGSNGRGPSCNPANDCCMRSFVITFSELEWDDWIEYPPSYTANYCTGVCRTVAPSGEYHTHHSQVLNTWIMSQSESHPNSPMPACCVPSSLGSLDIIFREENGSLNRTSLADMTANGCHCVID